MADDPKLAEVQEKIDEAKQLRREADEARPFNEGLDESDGPEPAQEENEEGFTPS